MVFMFGVILGNKLKQCKLRLLYIHTFVKYIAKPINNIFYGISRTECYDYLFDVAIQMKQCGLNPMATPAEYELHYQTNELKI